MKFPSSIDQRVAIRAALILVASAAVGLAYNALNPAGLSWREPGSPDTVAPMRTQAPAGLYRTETVSARLVSVSTRSAETRTPSQPTGGVKVAETTPVRTTWEKVQPLVASGQVVMVDSRSRLSYEAGHIPAAVNLPQKEIDANIGDFLISYPPPDSRLVIYCASEKCASSSKLAALLAADFGYEHVQYVPGGYLDWLRSREKTNKSK